MIRNLEKILGVVDRCLRMTFPDDYEARCMYGACAVQALIEDAGGQAILAGGNMLAFTISGNGDPPVAQGFGGGDAATPSHFWVESDKRLIDLGPHYLPKRSNYPVLPMPMVAWDNVKTLPNFLYYQSLTAHASDVRIVFPPDIADRMEKFLAKCRHRYAALTKTKLRTWLLTGEMSLHAAIKRRDRWAMGAQRFEERRLSLVPPEPTG